MTKFNPQRNSTVVAELKLLNPWVDNTDYGDDIVQLARALLGDIGPISEKAHFEQRLATMGRFAAGRAAWNSWSQNMLEVRGLAGSDPALVAVCDALAIANFSGTRFTEDVDFAALVFPGRADFCGSEFEADCWFQGSTFYGSAVFRQVSFMGEASFERATFYGLADFANSVFMQPGQFRQSQILGQAMFESIDFARGAWFTDSKINSAEFSDARFGDSAAFTNCEFSGPASFSRAMFQKTCGFEGASFLELVDMREVDVNGAAWFGNAKFKTLPKLEDMYVAGGGDFRDIMAPA
ncbi:MAG: pentapeptide repeat-containing protein [Alphaproteobacteria bacterium]|nr:pentapeptide repeat-containing protein [Alphaproteobacteria bacterium]